MITIKITKEKIKINGDSKEDLKYLKNKIKSLVKNGFSKNSAKAIVLTDLIKTFPYEHKGKEYIFDKVKEEDNGES